MSSKSLDFNEILSNAMMQFSKHPPQSPLNKGGIKEGYALQELPHGIYKVLLHPDASGLSIIPLLNAFSGLTGTRMTEKSFAACLRATHRQATPAFSGLRFINSIKITAISET